MPIVTSLIIPCYDEAEGVPQLCQRLGNLIDRLGPERDEVEVLFVDDGSGDGTADVIRREAGALPYRIVTHPRNLGLGAALKTGFRESRGRELVTLDSDCTYAPERCLELLATLRAGADVVTGSPYHPRGEVVGVPEWRLVLSKGLSRMYWMILPVRLHTYTSCFRAYRRDVALALEARDDGFLAVAQLLVSAILIGARIVEQPERLSVRQFGRSKLKVIRVILGHLRYIGRLVLLRAGSARDVRPGTTVLGRS